MEAPDVIYLIDTGDEISWCDDPNPSGDLEPDDSVAYVKKEQRDELLNALVLAEKALAHCKPDIGYSSKHTDASIAINRVIAKAKG